VWARVVSSSHTQAVTHTRKRYTYLYLVPSIAILHFPRFFFFLVCSHLPAFCRTFCKTCLIAPSCFACRQMGEDLPSYTNAIIICGQDFIQIEARKISVKQQRRALAELRGKLGGKTAQKSHAQLRNLALLVIYRVTQRNSGSYLGQCKYASSLFVLHDCNWYRQISHSWSWTHLDLAID